MKGIFKKIFNLSSDEQKSPGTERLSQKSKHLDREPVSPELEFAQNFTASGGKFIYCENVDDALENIGHIAAETGLKSLYCPNSNLRTLSEKIGIFSYKDSGATADLFFSDCEYLVSYNGGVMVDAIQTHGNKLHELPEVFIILAYSDQLVRRLNEALAGIRSRYSGGEMPSQITTIHGPLKNGLDDPAAQRTSKDIYLLYVDRNV